MITSDQKQDLDEKFQEEFNKIKEEIKIPNILLVGGTGVGKSTIVNMIFGEGTVDVGEGRPVTKGIHKILMENKPISLYDTEGFEIGSDEKFQQEIVELVAKNKDKEIEDQIHLIWHVVSASSTRLTEYDKNLHNQLKDFNIPVALIFSKCDEVEEADLEALIEELDPNLTFKKAFFSNQSPFFSTDDKQYHGIENFSLNKVVDWSIQHLPEALKFGFISSQMVNLEAKRKEADSIIKQHTTGNALVGGSPIPFSDAPILIASQSGMLARILIVYGFKDPKTLVSGFMSSSGLSLLISNFGRSLVGNIIKLIPGVGSVVGAMISAGVASAITFAMGKTTSEILFRLNKDILEGDSTKAEETIKDFEPLFKELFYKYFSQWKDDKKQEK